GGGTLRRITSQPPTAARRTAAAMPPAISAGGFFFSCSFLWNVKPVAASFAVKLAPESACDGAAGGWAGAGWGSGRIGEVRGGGGMRGSVGEELGPAVVAGLAAATPRLAGAGVEGRAGAGA